MTPPLPATCWPHIADWYRLTTLIVVAVPHSTRKAVDRVAHSIIKPTARRTPPPLRPARGACRTSVGGDGGAFGGGPPAGAGCALLGFSDASPSSGPVAYPPQLPAMQYPHVGHLPSPHSGQSPQVCWHGVTPAGQAHVSRRHALQLVPPQSEHVATLRLPHVRMRTRCTGSGCCRVLRLGPGEDGGDGGASAGGLPASAGCALLGRRAAAILLWAYAARMRAHRAVAPTETAGTDHRGGSPSSEELLFVSESESGRTRAAMFHASSMHASMVSKRVGSQVDAPFSRLPISKSNDLEG